MKLSVKTDYACRAIEALALHFPDDRPMRIDEIAQRMSIPANYLVQILIELKNQGLIRSHRGKAGGYLLAKQPHEISVGNVIRAIHGQLVELPELEHTSCPPEIQRVWHNIKIAAESTADRVTFDVLCAESAAKPQMYHI